eukprot:6427142-Amphidinium_carterae.1
MPSSTVIDLDGPSPSPKRLKRDGDEPDEGSPWRLLTVQEEIDRMTAADVNTLSLSQELEHIMAANESVQEELNQLAV